MIHEDGLTSTEFTPSADLAPGSYRDWVRAINATGMAGPFSVPLDFTVTASNSQSIDDGEADEETLLASLSAMYASAEEVATAAEAGPAAVVFSVVDETIITTGRYIR